MDGKFGSVSITEERARGTVHHPVIRTAPVKAANGIYPLGLIAGKNSDGDLVPIGDVEFAVTHSGTGPAATAKGAAAGYADAVVKIVAGGALGMATYALSLNGGATYGATTTTPATGIIAIGSTGVSLTLASGTHVANDLYTVSVQPSIYGVLDEKCDTASVEAALCIVHGSVKIDALKTNIAGDAPGTALLEALTTAGLFAE